MDFLKGYLEKLKHNRQQQFIVAVVVIILVAVGFWHHQRTTLKGTWYYVNNIESRAVVTNDSWTIYGSEDDDDPTTRSLVINKQEHKIIRDGKSAYYTLQPSEKKLTLRYDGDTYELVRKDSKLYKAKEAEVKRQKLAYEKYQSSIKKQQAARKEAKEKREAKILSVIKGKTFKAEKLGEWESNENDNSRTIIPAKVSFSKDGKSATVVYSAFREDSDLAEELTVADWEVEINSDGKLVLSPDDEANRKLDDDFSGLLRYLDFEVKDGHLEGGESSGSYDFSVWNRE